RMWGVETEGADAMAQALAAGKIVRLPAITSIAKTLGAPAVSEATLAAARQYLESVTVVSDHEAVAALRFLLERAKLLTEPAASCTLAAARRLAPHFTPSSHVVLILCGGNLAVKDLCAWTARGL
ncbi:MAG: pyridoxal-phosphate dependent enzyme, partial [Terriglobales bacterium]